MQKEPKILNQRKNAERKWPIEGASIRDALMYMCQVLIFLQDHLYFFMHFVFYELPYIKFLDIRWNGIHL